VVAAEHSVNMALRSDPFGLEVRGPDPPSMCTTVRMVCTIVRMGYLLLGVAIAAEVAATTAMKYSEGFSKLWPSLFTGVGYVISFVLLAQALKSMSIGTAYAIWSGVGTATVAALGLVLFGEELSFAKVAGIVLIIAGVVALNMGGAH
jgi:small multidrug resistance pump